MPSSTSTTHLVLVADDEPSMLELVARHLKSHDNPKLDILEASDGEEAWRLARERLPDLVVLDVMMPGMSGWEVCRKIREDVALAHTAVVMLTGIGENLNQMTSPLYGADAHIDKPFDFDELDVKVDEALAKRAKLRGNVERPAVNGVAGPAKVARSAGRAAPAKKPAASKKTAAKTAVRQKAAPKKAVAKKAVAKKAVAKKTGTKKAVAKKVAPKKAITKKAITKKAAKSGAKRATAKAPAKKKPASLGRALPKKGAKKSAKRR